MNTLFPTFQEDTLNFPLWEDPVSHHTMGKSLDPWAWSKVPRDFISRAAEQNIPIHIYGFYPEHLETFLRDHEVEIESFSTFSPTRQKKLNYIRPKFAFVRKKGKPILLVAVTPGRDYVYHYAGIIRYCLHCLGKQNLLHIYRDLEYEQTLTTWTNLGSLFIDNAPIVIMGFVEEAVAYLSQHSTLQVIKTQETPYYTVTHALLNHEQPLTFVGVKYSFWGNMSAHIVTHACEMNAQEIIYLGKLGALSTPHDLYHRLFSPTQYITLDYTSLIHVTTRVKNGIATMMPTLNSGVHISVPIVIGEDLTQRNRAESLRGQSIDNEISQMAHAVMNFNTNHKKNIPFSPLHFATNYLRKKDELSLKIDYDLSNTRKQKALQKKVDILNHQMHTLSTYLNKKTLP